METRPGFAILNIGNTIHTIPHYTTLYHTIPYYTILYHTVPHYTTLYHRLQCTAPTNIYVSVLPISNPMEGNSMDANKSVSLTVATSIKKAHTPTPMNLWDFDTFTSVSTDKAEAQVSHIREKGQESSLWGLHCVPSHYYHIVPNFQRKGMEGSYIMRVFATEPIFLETVPSTTIYTMTGEWRKLRDKDSTGGNLTWVQPDDTVKENAKFCQNPQYHLEVADPYGKDEIYLKVVLNRTDKDKGKHGHTAYTHDTHYTHYTHDIHYTHYTHDIHYTHYTH